MLHVHSAKHAASMARTKPPPRKPEFRPPEAPKRRKNGTYAPGASGCPGGRGKTSAELRKACIERTDQALEKIDAWMESGEFEQQRAAVDFILTRGYGRPAKPSELPNTEAAPAVASEKAGTDTVLQQVRGLLARAMAGIEQRLAAGEVTVEDVATLGKVGHTLGELLKVEKEAARASDLSKLTTEELVALVLQHVEPEVLRAALEKSQGQSGGAP